MNALIPMTFENKPVRVVTRPDGEPWFVAPDVSRVLEMTNVTIARRVLDEDEKASLNSVEGVAKRHPLLNPAGRVER